MGRIAAKTKVCCRNCKYGTKLLAGDKCPKTKESIYSTSRRIECEKFEEKSWSSQCV